MKLSDVLTLGVAPNDANCTLKIAQAVQAFIAKIDVLKVGGLAVQTFQAAPGQAFKVPLEEVEGVIPEDRALEYYVYLDGPVGAPDWHNCRAIYKMLSGPLGIRAGLKTFLDQFAVAWAPERIVILDRAIGEALAKAWNEANGIVEPAPVEPPVVVPPVFPGDLPVVGNPSFVHNRYGLGRLAVQNPAQYPEGSTYTDERGTFIRRADYWEKQD